MSNELLTAAANISALQSELSAEKDASEQLEMMANKLHGELVAVTAERDALKHALIELESAAEVYAADQSRATDSRCGLVQPITVEDGNRLLSALKIANELSTLPRLGGDQ